MSHSTAVSFLFLIISGIAVGIAEPLLMDVLPQGLAGLLIRDWLFGALAALVIKGVLVSKESQHRALEGKLLTAATHDPLTFLLNRGAFDTHLDRAIESGRRSEAGFGVAFLDLDDFKAANDRFGHAFGDAVLMAVADRLRGLARKADVVARFGGDEFAVIIEPADGDSMEVFTRRLHQAFQEALNIEGISYPVSLSVGTACFPVQGRDRASLLKTADAAMYRMKRQRAGGFIARRAPYSSATTGGSQCSNLSVGWS